MISISDLPAVNAILNATSAILLVTGRFFIHRKKVALHKTFMLAAFGCSVLFLLSYLTYHYHIGSKPFAGQGWIRYVYFSILISHTVLAAAIVPLAIVTLARGLTGRFEKHRRIAVWTFPIWVYVSITGVVIYLMLYQLIV